MADAARSASGSAIAQAFVAARRARVCTPAYPGPMPQGLQAAYAIQREAIALWGDAVAGWKVGLIQPPHDALAGQSRLFGPIFRAAVCTAQGDASLYRPIAGGFAAVEAEYVVQLGDAIAPAIGWTAEIAAARVAAVHVGVELAGSPFAEINGHGPFVTISDFGNNSGLILGAAIQGGLAGLAGQACSMWIDDVQIASGGPDSIPGGPIGSVVELLNHMGRHGLSLPPGTLVSTGAATGVHDVLAGQSAVADFGKMGRIAVNIVPPC